MRYLLLASLGAILFYLATAAAFADPRTECPEPTPCKILLLNAQEEQILISERGILATAAQARTLDLAALATYFQQKIAKAPAGDPKEAAKSAEKPADGAVNVTPPDTKPK